MFIQIVDESLERHLRHSLPFPIEVGDVSFDVPSREWSDALDRTTINLYLFDITRSTQPNQGVVRAVDEDGRRVRRAPQPMIELNYMVSAWAGGSRTSHQLLGEIISRVAGLDGLPPEHVPDTLSSPIHLSFVEDDRHRARDIWNGAGNLLQAGFSMHVTAAADVFGWSPEPELVSGITPRTRRGVARAPEPSLDGQGV